MESILIQKIILVVYRSNLLISKVLNGLARAYPDEVEPPQIISIRSKDQHHLGVDVRG